VLLLSRVDLLEDLFVRGEAVRRAVGVNRLAVDGDLEDPGEAFLEFGGDPVLALDGGLQTGGLREVVSLPAVRDEDVHAPSLLPDQRLLIVTIP
jgi:hypothetical protein